LLGEFVRVFSKHLKTQGKLKIPAWATYVKTASFKELAPTDPDWVYVRAGKNKRTLFLFNDDIFLKR
jgi:small subunit ribosomal protein S19e